jgi:hypothetical protein
VGSVCGPARKRQCTAQIARYSPLIGQAPVALLALIGAEYAATERGTILTVARLTPKGPLSGYAPGNDPAYSSTTSVSANQAAAYLSRVASCHLDLPPAPTLRGWR